MKQSVLNFLRLLPIAPLFAMFLAVPLAMAAGSPAFNNLEGDQAFLQGRNLNQNGTFATTVQANATEKVDVAVYYHNTVAGSTATNTTIKINLPSNTGTQHSITGSLSADNATTVTQTMVNGQIVGAPNLTINSDTATTVSFVPGSVRWFPNDPKSTTGSGTTLPFGQNGNSIVTTGLRIGDIMGCFQFSGFVLFTVQLTGQTPVPQTTLSISKGVRRATTTNDFIPQVTANPGDQVEYQVTVRNLDGALTAKNVLVKDVLPAGITYLGPTILHRSNGTTQTLADGIENSNGILIGDLKPLETVALTYLAQSSSSITNNPCLVNTVSASASNAKNTPSATAQVCFLVPTPTPTPTPTPGPTPTPTPTPVPTPTPTPTLPRTGPEDVTLFLSVSASGAGIGLSRYYYWKRLLQKRLRNLDIL